MSLKASPKYSSPKVCQRLYTSQTSLAANVKQQPAKGEELNMLSGSHHSMGLEELHGSYLLDNWGIIELNMLGEPHLGRELPLQSCIITNVLALEKLDKICPLDTGILGILAELKSDPLDERRVTVDNRTVRSITPRARSRVQFGSLPRRSGLLKRMRSLGLKDSFVLSAVFFGSTVLADDPGGVGSGCNDRGHSATTASRILGYAYPFLVAGVAFFIRAKAQRAGGRQGRQEESLFYLVQVGISGIVYLQGLDSDNTTFLEMATYVPPHEYNLYIV